MGGREGRDEGDAGGEGGEVDEVYLWFGECVGFLIWILVVGGAYVGHEVVCCEGGMVRDGRVRGGEDGRTPACGDPGGDILGIVADVVCSLKAVRLRTTRRKRKRTSEAVRRGSKDIRRIKRWRRRGRVLR